MKKNRRPDEAALRRLLEREQHGPEGLILRLAWLEGLTREEIAGLTWKQVSFLDNRLELPDRMVPLDAELRPYLWRLREVRAAEDPEGIDGQAVALSSRGRAPLRPESISRLARMALDRGGQESIRLLDLRYDWISRQLETQNWPEVARISGVEVATLQIRFAGCVPGGRDVPPGQVDEFKLWKVLQKERNSPAGLALWLAWQLGLQAQEMASLTWEQVDLEGNRLCLGDREVTLTSAVRRLLEDTKLRRETEDDPHVLLTERSRKPIDLPRLSRMTRAALIRGGLERIALRDLRKDDSRDEEDEKILQRTLEQGVLSRKDVTELLGLSKTAAYGRLRRLVERRRLVRIGGKYYLPGTAVPPERHLELIRGYLERAGFAYRQDIVELLRIQPKQCTLVLRHLVSAGELVQIGQKYYLPQDEERKVE